MTEYRSIPALLADRAARTPDAEAFRYRDGAGWRSLSWRQAAERVRELALGLRTLGLGPEQRLAILAGTSLDWVLADLAALAAGSATTAVYPTSTAEECAFVLADSGSRVVVAEDAAQLAKLRQVRGQLPAVRHVVLVDATGAEPTPADEPADWVLTLAEVAARGRETVDREAYDRAWRDIEPDRLATLIYTSGTTGRPKGVELTHANWLYTAEAASRTGIVRPDDLHFLWLPLSHSFGKVLLVLMMREGVTTAIDGRADRIVENLGQLRPTIVAVAPRILEKIHNRVLDRAHRAGTIRRAIFDSSCAAAVDAARRRRAGRPRPPLLQARHALADRLVFRALRDRLGGRLRYLVSGSAPLAPDLAEFFDAAGIVVLEGYGLTESSAATFVNRPESYEPGTVGPPLPGTEVRFAEDGEILVRGGGVMRGYHGLPDETAATVIDGWLHTGDVGELDAAGRLRITDRKKDLIKTSGGKYVAPQLVENQLKAACPYVDQVVVHGDRRSYCTALVTLDPDTSRAWAADRGIPEDVASLAGDPAMRAEVESAVAGVNESLPRHARIRRFAVLPGDLTVEAGELTPSLKVRRKVVAEHYADVLDRLYAEPPRPEPAASGTGPGAAAGSG